MTHAGRNVALSAGTVLVLLGPAAVMLLLAVTVLMPTSTLGCRSGTTLRVVAAPRALTARTADGTAILLDREQLTRAAAIVAVAGRTDGAGPRAARVALMAALTESGLRMLANPSVPASLSHTHDGVGTDHDSLGLFQMRPSTGWGSVADLMDPTYQAEAFLGGAIGPNRGEPAGLLDIPDWRALSDGQAAQAVEVSAFPDRYTRYTPVADQILRTLTRSTPATTTQPADSTKVVFPLPAGSWTITDRFGPRADPITGRPSFHHGTDFAAVAGTPIRSATDGRVLVAGMVAGSGTITVSTRVDGRPTSVTYLHMDADGIDVHRGETVTAGQIIGAVGSTGYSTGPHLHFQVQPGDSAAPAIDSLTWLRTRHASTSSDAVRSTPCTPQ